MSMVFDKACGIVASMEHENSGLGQWTITRLQGTGIRLLVIVTVYIPIVASRVHLLAIAMKQSTILASCNISTNPTLLAWSDLHSVIADITNNGHDMIVMGDLMSLLFGTTFQDHALQLLCSSFQLQDAVKILFPEQAATSTFCRSNQHLDYILLSPGLNHAVQRSGIAPFGCSFNFNHNPVFCYLDLRSVYGSPPHSFVKPIVCQLNPSNICQDGRFLTFLGNLMTHCNIHQCCQQDLESVSTKGPTATTSRLAIGADCDFQDALLVAKCCCGRFYEAPWSKKLHHALPHSIFGLLYAHAFKINNCSNQPWYTAILLSISSSALHWFCQRCTNINLMPNQLFSAYAKAQLPSVRQCWRTTYMTLRLKGTKSIARCFEPSSTARQYSGCIKN